MLGAEGFGKYMLSISFISVIAVVAEGGIDILTVRELSSSPGKYKVFFAHTSFLKALSGLASALIAILATLALGMQWGMILLVAVASVYNFFNTLTVHFRAVFRGFEVLKYEAVSVIVEKVAVVVFCGVVLLAHLGVTAFMVGYALAYFVTGTFTLGVILFKVGMPSVKPKLSFAWSEVLRPALPFALLNIFTIIYFRSGTLMISGLTGREDFVGYYNAGYRLVESFMLFPTIIMAPLYPVLSRSRGDVANVRLIVLDAIRALLLISVSVSAIIFTFKEEVTLLLFGSGYKLAADSVGLLALTMIPISVNFAAGTLVAALGRQAKSNIFVFIVTILNLSLNYFLIRLWSFDGAAITTVITETLLVIFNLGVVSDYVPWRKMLKVFGKTLVPGALAAVSTLLLVRHMIFPLQAAIAVTIMVVGFVILRLLTLDDIRRLVRIR